ncbi:MAG: group I intron-associated PD-(D/E)XK endonuclease [Cetobacterium sp.]
MNLQHANGAAAEMLVASRFFSAGYEVYHPLATQSKADLVVYKDGQFLKVQVKKATPVTIGNSTSHQVRLGGCGRAMYSEGDYDIMAVADGDIVRLFTWEETKDKKSMCVGKRNQGTIL